MRRTPTLVNRCTIIDDTLFVLEHFCEVRNDTNSASSHIKAHLCESKDIL